MWLTVNDFCDLRSSPEDDKVDTNSKEFQDEDDRLFDARNFYVKGATFNYRHTYQLSVAISKMQGLTNSLRVSFSANRKIYVIVSNYPNDFNFPARTKTHYAIWQTV